MAVIESVGAHSTANVPPCSSVSTRASAQKSSSNQYFWGPRPLFLYLSGCIFSKFSFQKRNKTLTKLKQVNIYKNQHLLRRGWHKVWIYCPECKGLTSLLQHRGFHCNVVSPNLLSNKSSIGSNIFCGSTIAAKCQNFIEMFLASEIKFSILLLIFGKNNFNRIKC